MTDEKKVVVTRTIDASPKEIFDLLSLPSRHHEFDGSGMVQGDEKTNRIQAVGDVFVMNMHAEAMGGDYKMYNHVTGFDEGKLIAWQPAEEHRKDEPAGWEWSYALTPVGTDQTEVTLTYSWEKLTDASIEHMFPAITKEQLEQSLADLAAAVAG